MADVFMATLGQRPEAITVALDVLRERYAFVEIVILHTEPYKSGIADAWRALYPVLRNDYDGLPVRGYEITAPDGLPIIDVDNQASATAYFHGMLRALDEYKQDGFTLHLLVAGGRKAMSIYATQAASFVFGSHDQVWTILSPQEMLGERGIFHIPAGLKSSVSLVNLPILTSRAAPGSDRHALLEDPERYIRQRRDLRTDFLSRLSDEERRLVELMQQHRRATSKELAAMLNKSKRTVDNQFGQIYDKMVGYFDHGDQARQKRQVLLDILEGRV